MSTIMAITRKEWKAAFLSPVALIFLGIFLAASLFVFFFVEGFFARNIADAKPFFAGMPILLVLLTSAFTMRLWSEETRSGTLEVLLTFPIRIHEVVLGKFFAGLGLVVVALALTLPVPITIAMLGNLDWGPVVGGYLGLVLLSGAYLAIGMFISSLTVNALVALLMSIVVCGFLVLLGYLPKLVPLGMTVDEVFRALGTGSRFDSMLRGVLDLRDLVYYSSLAGFFLLLNGLALERRRWGKNRQGQSRRRNIVLAVVLLGVNLLVFNLGLIPAAKLRADLTEWNEYSISPVTRDLLQGVSEPLLVRGYFSDKTHPLLAPLVPRIQDFLHELQIVGQGRITAEFIDPTKSEDLEKEAQSKYAIKSVPFRVPGRHEQSVVNAYFHILVRYGDGHEVLSFDDLIHVEAKGMEPIVSLRNLEYDVAKAIQKVVYGFKSIEAICKQFADKAVLKVFASSTHLPEELREVPKTVEKIAGEFKKRCSGRFDYQIVDPDRTDSIVTPESLYQKYGIKPMALSLFDDRRFYLHLLMEVGGRSEILDAASGLTEADIRKELEASLQRHAPGFLKTIGLVSPKPKPPAHRGMPPQGSSYRSVQEVLKETYEVSETDLSTGRVPGDVDILLVLNPTELGDKERYALDQYLMRGGSVIIAGGAWMFEPSMRGELNVNSHPTGLDDLLKSYGVEVGKSVVMDEANAAFPVPVERNLGGFRVQEIQLVNYPPFVRVHDEGLSKNPAATAVPMVVLHWPSPVRCTAGPEKAGDQGGNEGVSCETLLASSENGWEVANFSAQPNFDQYPDLGFAKPAKQERIPLAVTLSGTFTSYYKDREPPVFEGEPAEAAQAAPSSQPKKGGHKGAVIERSEANARLVVLGSAAFLEDVVLGISRQVTDTHQANLMFLSNLADWSVEDIGLSSIRSREHYARALKPLEAGEKIAWEAGNFGFAVLAIVFIGLLTLGRRGRATPILSGGREDQEGRHTS